ncbi:FCD domain-containing protein [Bradyrhizobium canariense]|uniref:FCD domain-containing protein n=1 Tax=Bradyrhizobium canariense TaxID=255045 RepID=UPI0024BF9D4D|nr:FCD domain-containing protein [Bradyrhizobium canariense]
MWRRSQSISLRTATSGIRRSRDEHEAIMQVIAEGDRDTAARRMRAHMLNAAAALRRYIDDRFGKQYSGDAPENI